MKNEETSAFMAIKIRQHCSGCPECQRDAGCAVYSLLRSKHRRLAAAEGDAQTVQRYDMEDEELRQEMEYYRQKGFA